MARKRKNRPEETVSNHVKSAGTAEVTNALGLDRDESTDVPLMKPGQFPAKGFEMYSSTAAQPWGGPGQVPVCPPEVRTPEAAKILGVSKDTVLKLREAGVLPYRNAAPPGSTRPVFRFPLDAVLKLRTSYQTENPAPQTPKEPPRRRVRARKYKHLNIGDD